MSLLRTEFPPFGTLILPVYNAGAFLEESLRAVSTWLTERHESWELVVVDDASDDGTREILDRFLSKHPSDAITRIRFRENRGKGFSVRAGLGLARGTYAMFTDCDLAYPMENADRIVSRLEGGADVATACRVLPASTYLISPSFFSYLYTRHLTGRVFNLVCRALTVPRLLDTQAGLKGFRTAIVRPLLPSLVLNRFSFDVELLRALLDRGARIVEVPVSFRYDTEPSTVSFVLDSLRMLRDLVRIRLRSARGAYRVPERQPGPASLVVHADDFGLAPGVNRAIEEGLESGALTSASILLGGPYARSAVTWAAGHSEFDFGVHLNLTYGRPTLPPEQVESLVDSRGRFHGLATLLCRLALKRIRMEEVIAEWRAQIEAIDTAGVVVSHLDSHQHVHLAPGLFRRAALPLATERNLALRTMNGPAGFLGRQPDFKGILLAWVSRVSLRRAKEGVVGAHGAGTALMRSPTLPVLGRLLRRMDRDETYELVVHPGHVDAALRRTGDSYVERRERERSLISSEEFRVLLRNSGIRDVSLKAVRGTAIRKSDSRSCP
jgi:predicted glycoside hydrolase/deacetylase ChbG (UPF0249 family)